MEHKPSYLTRFQRDSKGSALIMALVIILILFMMGAALLTLSLNSQQGANWFIKKQQAFYLAEAGIEHARTVIDETTLPIPQNGQLFVSGNLAGGTYSTFIWDVPSRDNKTYARIQSHGRINNQKAIVEAIIELTPTNEVLIESFRQKK